MSMTLYAHPFAGYCWKVLIALYENTTPFNYRLIEDEAGWAELRSCGTAKRLTPTQSSPAASPKCRTPRAKSPAPR